MTSQWETIERRTDGSSTSRLIVPHGWLVRCVEAGIADSEGTQSYAVAVTFVADRDREWIIGETDDASG